MDPRTEDELDARAEESRFRKLSIDASPAVVEWCRRFLDGETLNANATVTERQGWLLSRMAPARFHKRPDPQPTRGPFDDVDDDALLKDAILDDALLEGGLRWHTGNS